MRWGHGEPWLAARDTGHLQHNPRFHPQHLSDSQILGGQGEQCTGLFLQPPLIKEGGKKIWDSEIFMGQFT